MKKKQTVISVINVTRNKDLLNSEIQSLDLYKVLFFFLIRKNGQEVADGDVSERYDIVYTLLFISKIKIHFVQLILQFLCLLNLYLSTFEVLFLYAATHHIHTAAGSSSLSGFFF